MSRCFVQLQSLGAVSVRGAPVTTGDAVARPVVEVLVAHDALDGGVVAVRGGGGRCQHQPRVEHIEGLVLHGAHVEVVHRHDVEQVQIVPTKTVARVTRALCGVAEIRETSMGDEERGLGVYSRP